MSRAGRTYPAPNLHPLLCCLAWPGPLAARGRSELKLGLYTFESCVAAVLRLRVPHIPHTALAAWFEAGGLGDVRARRRTLA
jgi:hypothetical protein